MAGHEELMRALYAHFDRDEFEGARQYMHPDVEWHSSGVFPGLEPVYRGRDAVERWWRDLRDPFERFAVEVQRIWEAEDVVVTEVRFQAKGRESGVAVDLPFAHSFRFENGLIVYYAAFATVEEALADAGIDPASGASA